MAKILTVEDAAAIVERGGVVVLPTETVYGLAGRPTEDVVHRIFELKERPPEKNMQLLIPSSQWFDRIARRNPVATRFADAFWPGPLTLVVAASETAPAALASDGSIGLRVPAHPIALELLARCGPLAASSANRSGEATPDSIDAIAAVFGDAVDGYLDAGPIAGGGSTVVDARARPFTILRQGPIDRDDLENAMSGRFDVP